MDVFKTPELSDKAWIDRLLSQSKARGCDYNFGNIYIWKDFFKTRIAETAGCFTEEMTIDGCPYYLCPEGPGYERALEELSGIAASKGEALRLLCVTKEELSILSEKYPGAFTVFPDRDGFDYIYDISDLADLSGRKYHGKKNHVNRFRADNPDWSFEALTPDSFDECLAMDSLWLREHEAAGLPVSSGEAASAGAERNALELCFMNWQALGLSGGVLRTGRGIAAFTVGELMPCGDTADIHFEKALSSVPGAYAAVNREFSAMLKSRFPELKYLNREEDMGISGLRTAKESYHPTILLEEYTVVFNKTI